MVEAKRRAVLRRWGVRGLSIGTGEHLRTARLIIHQEVLFATDAQRFARFATHSTIGLDPSNLTLETLLGVDLVLELALIMSSYFVLLE
jgi:hypothetical protein